MKAFISIIPALFFKSVYGSLKRQIITYAKKLSSHVMIITQKSPKQDKQLS